MVERKEPDMRREDKRQDSRMLRAIVARRMVKAGLRGYGVRWPSVNFGSPCRTREDQPHTLTVSVRCLVDVDPGQYPKAPDPVPLLASLLQGMFPDAEVEVNGRVGWCLRDEGVWFTEANANVRWDWRVW